MDPEGSVTGHRSSQGLGMISLRREVQAKALEGGIMVENSFRKGHQWQIQFTRFVLNSWGHHWHMTPDHSFFLVLSLASVSMTAFPLVPHLVLLSTCFSSSAHSSNARGVSPNTADHSLTRLPNDWNLFPVSNFKYSIWISERHFTLEMTKIDFLFFFFFFWQRRRRRRPLTECQALFTLNTELI